MSWIKDVLRGIVIGLANVIPGVSGGTMMVSMGVYDKLIWCINHLFSQFKKCVKILLPYALGMAIAVLAGAVGLKHAFAAFPLPTNALFIGLILGSLPFILKEMKGEKIGAAGICVFLVFFALVVGLKIIEKENTAVITLNAVEIIKLLALGMVASATMVIPGVSGSMMLKTLGYYEPIVTSALPDLMAGVAHGDGGMILHSLGVLLPFAVGIVIGIFGVAKLIEMLLRKWKGLTYCGILGMVAASPVVILMNPALYDGIGAGTVIASAVLLGLGVLTAMRLGGEPETPAGTEA